MQSTPEGEDLHPAPASPGGRFQIQNGTDESFNGP
jgi:hypothetical protein